MGFAERLRARESLVGTWLSLRDPTVAEVVAELEPDFVVVDTEHTTTSLETVLEQVRAVAAAGTKTATLVRIPWNDHVAAKRVLDTGAAGVMAPMVGDAEEASELVRATRYPPAGRRGVAAGRASRYGLDLAEYVAGADEEVVTVAQVETERGLDNVEGIAATEGVDALFVGPADLSASLGVFGEYDHPEFVAAVERVVEAAHDADTPAATLAVGEEEVRRAVDRGFDAVVAGTDTSHLLGGVSRAQSAFAEAVDEREE